MLNFRFYVPDFDPASYRLGSTMLFFRNNSTISLNYFPRENCPAIANTVAYASPVLNLWLALGCAKLVRFCYNFIFQCLMATLNKKH